MGSVIKINEKPIDTISIPMNVPQYLLLLQNYNRFVGVSASLNSKIIWAIDCK